jgi:Retrotransposon gag protein/Zinc knuckle
MGDPRTPPQRSLPGTPREPQLDPSDSDDDPFGPGGPPLSPPNPPGDPQGGNPPGQPPGGGPPAGPPGGPPPPPLPQPPVPPPTPPPGVVAVPAAPVDKKKSHVKKPEDFTEPKQWDCFRRQVFVYIEENKQDFDSDEQVIRFLLNFMTEGLPEKFTANYLDDILDNLRRRRERAQAMWQPLPTGANWGSAVDFEAQCHSVFGDQNKRPNAENQLALLQQGAKTAEEYFQEFDQLVRTAGYQQYHDDVLVKYLHEQVKWSIVDKIYSSGHLPNTYQEWRSAIINVDRLDWRRTEQKKILSAQHPRKAATPGSFLKTTTEKRTGTGVTYTGQGQKMDVDQAKAKGLCFRCSKSGHMARNCPDKPKFQVHTDVLAVSIIMKTIKISTLLEVLLRDASG